VVPLGSNRSPLTYGHKVCPLLVYGHSVCVPFAVELIYRITVHSSVSVAEGFEHPLPVSDGHERHGPGVLAGAARDEHGVDVPVVDVDVIERGPAHS
jgi:hypothetical protein